MCTGYSSPSTKGAADQMHAQSTSKNRLPLIISILPHMRAPFELQVDCPVSQKRVSFNFPPPHLPPGQNLLQTPLSLFCLALAFLGEVKEEEEAAPATAASTIPLPQWPSLSPSVFSRIPTTLPPPPPPCMQRGKKVPSSHSPFRSSNIGQ